MGSSSECAFHNSDIGAYRTPSLPVLYCPFGSIIGGAVTHMFSRPTNERYHPAGLIFSTLGAILVLFICYKLKIHFPQV